MQNDAQQRLKDAVEKVRKPNGWTFQRAWAHLQSTQPTLFEGEPYHVEQGQASAHTPVYRFVDRPTGIGRSMPSKPLRELLADFGEETVRVEA